MQKRSLLATKRAFRFLRWSRNAAASFHSIHLVVTVGRLHANVLERIALKCSNALLALLVGRRVVPELPENGTADNASWPSLEEEQLLVATPTELATASPISI